MGLGCPECGSLHTGVHKDGCSVGEHESYLCVGGPAAGKRVSVKGVGSFAVPVMTETLFTNSHGDVQQEFERREYRREIFRTPQGEVSMWVPLGQTELETMTKLLDSYERCSHEEETMSRKTERVAHVVERGADTEEITVRLHDREIKLTVSREDARKIRSGGTSNISAGVKL